MLPFAKLLHYQFTVPCRKQKIISHQQNLKDKDFLPKKEIKVWFRCILVVIDDDLAGVEVADGGEGLLGEVERGLAAGRRAAVDDLDGDGAAVAGVRGVVGAPDAGDRVHDPASRASVPREIFVFWSLLKTIFRKIPTPKHFQKIEHF